MGMPLHDIAVLALPIAACVALLFTFVGRYGVYFPSKPASEPAALLVSASLPVSQATFIESRAPVVGEPFLRPSFGLGAYSAETDRLPDGTLITPVPSMIAPETLALLPTPERALDVPLSGEDTTIASAVALDVQPDVQLDPAIRPLTRPHNLTVMTMAVAPGPDAAGIAGFRPMARPDIGGASLAALSIAPEADMPIEETPDASATAIAPPDQGQPLLETYAVSLSPRPAYRPARLLSAERALEAVNAAPDAVAAPPPTAAIAPQLASFGQTDGPLVTGPTGQSCSRRLSRAIPRRANRAATGSAFISAISATSGGGRDQAIAREAMSGNIPKFLRNLVPVTFTGTLANGRQTVITICVTPDYLALGSDADYVRVPLGLSAAGQIADHFNMMLPTTRMVDAIYAQAAVRLSPQPMQAGAQMSSTPYFLRHNATVEQQRVAARGPLGALVSGHKKDLVLTNRLASSPGRVAIYGWHRGNGRPIQPLSTVHGANYADYSHGIRLVSQTAFVNGRAADLQALLQDRQYAQLLNSGGVIGRPAIRLAGL